jgi:hypothetical protein
MSTRKKTENSPSNSKKKRKTSSEPSSENPEVDLEKEPNDDEAKETKDAKRERRLERNREAAQQFRQRQKTYIQDLETKVSTLTNENSEFRAKVEILNSENKLIKEQLTYLRQFISQAIALTFPSFAGPPGAGIQPPPPLIPLQNNQSGDTSNGQSQSLQNTTSSESQPSRFPPHNPLAAFQSMGNPPSSNNPLAYLSSFLLNPNFGLPPGFPTPPAPPLNTSNNLQQSQSSVKSNTSPESQEEGQSEKNIEES